MDPKTAAVLTTNRRSWRIPQMPTAIKANAQTIEKTVSEIWKAPSGNVVRSKSKNLPASYTFYVNPHMGNQFVYHVHYHTIEQKFWKIARIIPL